MLILLREPHEPVAQGYQEVLKLWSAPNHCLPYFASTFRFEAIEYLIFLERFLYSLGMN